MDKCKLCKKEDLHIASFIGLCASCIKTKPEALKIAEDAHARSRAKFNLPPKPPRGGSVKCPFCANECELDEGETGFCGEKKAVKGTISYEQNLLASYYYDSLPTNCVSAWCCANKDLCAGFNLAVFCNTCSFDCLFCQNWTFRGRTFSNKLTDDEFISAIKDHVKCVCFFGGDPSPQLHKIVRACKRAEKAKEKVRFCLETNGNTNPKFLEEFAKLALRTGGTIKIDLKFWSEELSLAISGISNKAQKENFKMLAKYHSERPDPPLLTASTLLIPGYVDEEEVKGISEFIASLDPSIPYSLLAFYPCFEMNDLPTTTRKLAESCLKAAKEAGLERVHIGNIHLLS